LFSPAKVIPLYICNKYTQQVNTIQGCLLVAQQIKSICLKSAKMRFIQIVLQ